MQKSVQKPLESWDSALSNGEKTVQNGQLILILCGKQKNVTVKTQIFRFFKWPSIKKKESKFILKESVLKNKIKTRIQKP